MFDNKAPSYRVLMEREDYRKIISFLEEDIEDYKNIPPNKRTKKDKQLYEYSKRLLKIAQSKKQDFAVIDKMASL